MARRFLVAAVLALTLAFSGCVSPSNTAAQHRTIAQAKADYFDAENQLRAAIPKQTISKTHGFVATRDYLMPCATSSPDLHWWAGGGGYVLKPGTDIEPIFAHIKSDWSAKAGWTVADRSEPNRPSFDFTNSDGRHLSIYWVPKQNLVSMGGSTACFNYPGYEPHLKEVY